MGSPKQSNRESSGSEGSDRSREITRFFQRLQTESDFDPEFYLKQCPEVEQELKELFHKIGGLPEMQPCSETKPWILGDYKVLREIGAGGMASVFEAEQISLKRKVALKLLPSHMNLSERAILKFQREAEAGGRQCHPGIVAVYAVGEIEKIHFIAQELVTGNDSLEKKLEALRREETRPPGRFRETARFIVKVAEALHHAHSSGVVHRDVKPSNILLTVDGQPKVTDFGLARVEDALTLSRTGDFSGTPFYMSPEQATGRRSLLDHRTDIYSLGVTLYEMLTLQRPFQGTSTHTVLKHIVEREPGDPRKIDPGIPRDLAVICLKAMDKEPAARYQTMVEFSDDLRRFLQGKVILARPAGVLQRLVKKVKRNPALSVAGGVAITALLVLVVYILWSYPITLRERNQAILARAALEEEKNRVLEALDRAEAEGAKAAAISRFLNEIMASPEPGRDGYEVKVVEVLNRAAQEAGDVFAAEPEVEAGLRKVLGQTYYGLGEYAASFEQYGLALELFSDTLGKEHPITLQAMKNQAMLLAEMGNYQDSDALHERVLSAQRGILGESHPETLRTLNNLGVLRKEQGRFEEAETLLRTAWEGRKEHLGVDDACTLETQANLGVALRNLGKVDEAIPLLREVADIHQARYGEEDVRTVQSMTNLVLALQDKGHLAEAVDFMAGILEHHRRTLGDAHADTLKAMCNLAGAYGSLGRYEEAEPLCSQAVEAFKKVLGPEHPATLGASTNWAGVLKNLGRLEEAETLLRDTQEAQVRILGERHPHVLISKHSLVLLLMAQDKLEEAEFLARELLEAGKRSLGNGHAISLAIMGTLANTLGAQGKHGEAEEQLRQTLAICREVLSPGHPSTVETLNNVGYYMMQQGRLAEADALFREGLALARQHLPPEHPELVQLQVNLGRCLCGQEQYGPAEPILLEGYNRLKAELGEQDEDTREALSRLVELYAAWGKNEEEAIYRARLIPATGSGE